MVMVKRQWLVWALLACLVLVNGFTAAPSVAHAGHHATHQAGSHSTGLCAWLCAAGQAIETAPVWLASPLRLADLIEDVRIHQYDPLFSPLVFLRGPPSPAR